MLQNLINYLTSPAEISNGLLCLVFYYFLYFFIKDIKRSDIWKAFIEELKK